MPQRARGLPWMALLGSLVACGLLAAGSLYAKAGPKTPPGAASPTKAQSYVASRSPSYKGRCPSQPAKRPLKITSLYQPRQLNPLLALSLIEHRASELVFERLFRWDPKGNPMPVLALKWSLQDKGYILAFALRPDVKWHDGKPFTAHDVAFTLRQAMAIKLRRSDQRLHRMVKKIVIHKRWELHVKLYKPASSLNAVLPYFQQKIIPRHHFSKAHHSGTPIDRSHVFGRRPVGTGPFVMTRWIGLKIIYSKNQDYWYKHTPCVRRLYLQSIRHIRLHAPILRHRGSDAAMEIDPQAIKKFPTHSYGVHALHRRSWYQGFNPAHSLFSKPTHRKHLNDALKKQRKLLTVVSHRVKAYWLHPTRFFSMPHRWSK